MGTDVTQSESTLSRRVAEEIRAMMARRRVTGAALARSLDKSTAWVSYRLSGAQPIDLNDLERIAAVLEVDVTDLLPRRRPVTAQGEREPAVTWTKPVVTNQPRPSSPMSRTAPKRSTTRPSRVVPHAAEFIPDTPMELLGAAGEV